MPVVEKSAVIANRVGLHARPASLFVQAAAKFQSKIQLQHGDKTVNAKSILNVLKIGAALGDTVQIRAEGDDAEEAVNTLLDLINRKFGEAE